MCGICGYAGLKEPAAPLLREMLVTMEKYKLGYESAGIATIHKGKIICLKDTGSVEKVFPRSGAWTQKLHGSVGIGHTRNPSPEAPVGKSMFAHPFLSCDGKIVLVHNGTIYNYREIMDELQEHAFSSLDKASGRLNDSEVIVHLLEEEVEGSNGRLIEAAKKTCKILSSNLLNQFLFAFMHVDEPEKIYVVSGKDSTNKRKIAVGFKKGFGSIFASYRDTGQSGREPIGFEALRPFVNPSFNTVVLDYDTLAVLTKDSCTLLSLTG